jgi:ligand-binding sensor domain-containing protein/serine phosphatase RsbU (regulator of sigma subunit)
MPASIKFSCSKASLKARMIWVEMLFLFFVMPNGQVLSQDYDFRYFNSEDGLAQSYVYSILQDVHGYLWVGTGNGLTKYNGFGFENFTTGDSLADNFITCGISDGEGLWFGHMNGRLSFYDGRSFRAIDLPQSEMSPVTHFAKSSDGQIWAGTYADGLFKLGREQGVVKHYLFKDQILMVSFDFCTKDELLVGTTSGLLYCRLTETSEIEIIRSISEIPESKISGIQKMRNGNGYYVATENDGIFHLRATGKQFRISRIAAGKEGDFTGIQGILEDSQSDLWACSFGNGLIKMSLTSQGELIKINYLLTGGFTADNIKTVFEDREGNIWSGNYGEGLTQITPKTFSVFTFDKRSYGNSIFSMYFDSKYRWIGTEKGLLKMDPLTNMIVGFYGKGNGLPSDTVTAIYSADGTDLWIGTDKHGLFRMAVAQERIHKYPLGIGTLENSVTSITGKGDQIWIGTKKGLCNINTGTNRKNWYSISQGGLPHNVINCLFMDKTGKLWVSTRSNILSYIQDEKVHKIPIIHVTGVLVLGPITEDENSRIWVGSNGQGVLLIDSDSVRNLTVKEGLLSNYCYSLICDSNRNLWVGHKGGLSRIRITDFSVKPVQQFEGVTDSYQFNPNAVFKDPREEVWFGSDKGLVSYDASMEYRLFPPPVVGITSIKVNDREWDYQDKILLPPGKYKIQIDFIGVSLKEPTLVTYQYKLEGYDQWSDISKSTSVIYNHLTEGEYTFVLNASSGDGTVSEKPLTISIIIKKPLWKKWWFYVVIVSSLILLTFLYIKRREHRFLIERQMLEEKVRERTKEIQQQKNEIELQRDLIDKKNASITSSIQYASHIQNAVLPPCELIEKLFPDSFIMSRPKDIVSGDFYWLTEKDGKIVFTVADCTGHGVPGAFMSLLGITLLNEIVNVQGITQSDAIVTILRERVIHSLQQSRKDITTLDGIDIVLCVLDPDRKVIQYTGGMNDLVYIRCGELTIIKADHLSVSVAYEESCHFSMKEIAFQKGDVFYLFSDGYQDQFGGRQNKKYLSHRFYQSLKEIYDLPMQSQKEILEQRLAEWMKDNIQTDDITVMGIRF